MTAFKDPLYKSRRLVNIILIRVCRIHVGTDKHGNKAIKYEKRKVCRFWTSLE